MPFFEVFRYDSTWEMNLRSTNSAVDAPTTTLSHWSYRKTSKIVFTASLLDAQPRRNSVENKLASLLVQDSLRDASIFTWKTSGGAKQSTRRGGPV